MNYPQVPKAAVDGFAKVWNKGGISIILDETAKKFALDFANIALRSFIDQQISIANAKMKALQADAVAPVTTIPTPNSSGIILTD